MTRACLFSLCAFSTLLHVWPASAACVASSRSDGQLVGYDYIKINLVGMNSTTTANFQKGMDQWNASSCNTDGMSFPYFVFIVPGSGLDSMRTITATLYVGFNPDNDRSCGRFAGNDISLFEKAKKPDGSTVKCTAKAIFIDSVAHELGHTIGLADQYSANCQQYAMGQLSFTSAGLYNNRTVRSSEYAKARKTNMTPIEQDYEDPVCEGGDPSCDPWACGSTCNPSPMLIDLDNNGFNLVGPEDAVAFDIDGNGNKELISWTAADQMDGFLWLDRNGNEVVDSGIELFGNATPLKSGEIALHGYIALIEFDDDGDEWISPKDEVFSRLAVWVDLNHDGVTDHGETASLEEAHVEKIAVRYFRTRKRDKLGNGFYYNSRAWIQLNGKRKMAWTSDVFFVLAE